MSKRKHKEIYLEGMGYDDTDFIPCECCGAPAVDIHHIYARGMGGRRSADVIENLMALCRKHHNQYGDKTQWRDYLIQRHQYHLKERGHVRKRGSIFQGLKNRDNM